VALQALAAEADRKARLAKFEEDRRRESAAAAKAAADAKKRQEELDRQAAAARTRAAEAAASRDESARKQQQAQRERAAQSLRAQAKQAQGRGSYAQAVQLLQSASTLAPSDAVFRELGAARVEAEKAAHQNALADQKKRDEALKAQRDSAAKRVADEKARLAKAGAERQKAEEVRLQALYDGFVKQAKEQLAKKQYAQAVAAAESARRYKSTPESLKLLQDAQHAIALEEAAKKSAAEKARVVAEQKKREEAERKLKLDRESYLAAIKKGQDALVGKRYDEAVSAYQQAAKLFKTDAALSGLKTAEELRGREKARLDAERQAKEQAAQRTARMKQLIDQGGKLLAARQYAKAVESYREALKLAPGNVDAAAGLSRAERERDAEAARVAAALAKKPAAPAVDPKVKAQQEAYQKAMAQAKALFAQKKFADAIKAYDQALIAKPGDAAAIKGKKEAGDAAKKPAAPVKDPKAKQREEDYKLALSAARAAMKNRNYQGAVNAYNEALRLMPGDKTATAERAEAVKLQTQAAYDGWMKKGQEAMKAKKYADAVKAYDEALKLRPGDPQAVKGKKEAAAAAKKP
jgi:tetratricopeptide (TPR) repeat protein